MNACHACLRRMWLNEVMAPHIDNQRAVVEKLLSLSDLEMITLLGGQREEELLARYASFRHRDAQCRVAQARAEGLSLICQHADQYPDSLRALGPLAPPVLAINGSVERLVEILSRPAVAIVGTRKATKYGLTAAQKIAKDLSTAGMTIVSGMAPGIDSAAHAGALEAGGPTLAVLPGAPHRPYPSRRARLFQEIVATGAVISEHGPDMATWRWALQARNRVIAGLALATILIEAPKRSGALITVRHADRVGRWIGVLPGPVGISQSAGPNLLLAKARAGRQVVDFARVRAVRNAQDVLDLIYGEGRVQVPEELRQAPTAAEAALLAQITAGRDNVTMIDARKLADLTALELKGWLVRGAGGALTVIRN